MRCICCAVILASMLPLTASANNIDGKWKAWFVGPMANQPMTVAEMVFDLKAKGNTLTGLVYMANWPGDAPISDGKIDGNRISFTAIGKHPWKSGGEGWRSSGYPRLKFSGTIQGSKIKLRLIWDSVLIYGTRGADARELEMEGKKNGTF